MIYIIISILLKVYFIFNVLQKNYYDYRSVVKYTIKKFYILFITSISILLFNIFKHSIFEGLVIGAIVFQVMYLIKKSKVFLKITKRIIRLFISVILEVLLLSFFLPYLLIEFIIPILVIIANIINKPIEYLIKKKYITKATKRISKIDCVKIAITGSYGKTSVKNYINDVLKKKYIVKSSPKSFNTPLGISKFINNEEFLCDDFVIYEFGARKVNDIKELKDLFSYDISVVTSVGPMHIDTFKSLENIIEEKMSIVQNDKTHITILNYENEYIRNYEVNCKKYSYGFDFGDFRAKNIDIGVNGSEFDFYQNDVFIKRFKVKPLGKSAILNLLPAIIICYLYDISYENIEKIEMVENRLSLRKMNDYLILDDAYNSNIVGATYALEVLNTHVGKKFLITPGFVEMDLIKLELAKEYADKIEEAVDVLILVKNDFTILLARYLKSTKYYFVTSFKEGFDLFLKLKEDNSIVLIENDLLD